MLKILVAVDGSELSLDGVRHTLQWLQQGLQARGGGIEALEVENLIECAQATMVSAAARKECRGAHTVSDYERPADDPITPLGRDDANWMKHTLWHSDTNSLTYKPVNLKPLTVDSVPPKVRTF